MNEIYKYLILGFILGLIIGIDSGIWNYRQGWIDGKEQGLYNYKYDQYREGVKDGFSCEELREIREYANRTKP